MIRMLQEEAISAKKTHVVLAIIRCAGNGSQNKNTVCGGWGKGRGHGSALS